MPQKFQYHSLDSSEQEIRILELPPDQEASAIIRLSLMHVDLKDNPRYWTLSYTWGAPLEGLPSQWGDPNAVHKILVNDQEFFIQWNLEATLRRLAKLGVSALWADAICVNQNDIAERNHQFRIMEHVYRNYLRTLEWLGPDCSFSKQINCSLPHSTYLEDFRPDLSQILQRARDGYSSLLERCLRPETVVEDSEPMTQILRRFWFSRIWIVQEVVFSEDICLLWGQEGISWWDEFDSTIELIICCISEVDATTINMSPPRDHIYAGLGVLRACGDAGTLVVDCSLSVAEVFVTQQSGSWMLPPPLYSRMS